MDQHPRHSDDPADDAAQLGLAIVGEAAALHDGDDDAVAASEDNLHDVVDSLIDEPLTERQEQVVDSLAASGAALTAGLAGAVAADQDRPVEDVLAAAARSVLMQQRMADHGADDAES
jgi:hypothetical protein